jgi:hypothetical protein
LPTLAKRSGRIAMTTLEEAIALRDAMMDQSDRAAGEWFKENAQAFIIAYLRDHGPTPGEDLTDKCLQAGIIPGCDLRAFGGVYLSLSKRRIIHKTGTCLRRKGHATSGGNVWGLVESEG